MRSVEQDGLNRSSEQPVEICVSVPRCLSPEEVMELSAQAEAEEEAPAPLPAPAPSASVQSMFNLRQASQPIQQPSWISGQAMGVHRQASAPFPQSVVSSGISAGEQFPS